jgi:hypothetical protein
MFDVESVWRLRLAVMFLGERPQHQWWDTAFLNSLGCRYLSLVFPKNPVLSACTAAGEAACHVHEERIGKGSARHLFRLAPEMDLRVRALAQSLKLEELLSICSTEAALNLLDSMAAGASTNAVSGPVRRGSLKDLTDPASLAGLAAAYASGFRSGTPVFPYFT